MSSSKNKVFKLEKKCQVRCQNCMEKVLDSLSLSTIIKDQKLHVWNSGWAISNPERWCCESAALSSVQSLSCVRLFATPWTAARQAPCPSPSPGVHPNPCLLSRWCHPTISSSVIPFSTCPQSFPASGSFQMSPLSHLQIEMVLFLLSNLYLICS